MANEQWRAALLLETLNPLLSKHVQAVVDHPEFSTRELGEMLECSHETARQWRLYVYEIIREALTPFMEDVDE